MYSSLLEYIVYSSPKYSQYNLYDFAGRIESSDAMITTILINFEFSHWASWRVYH